MGWVTTRRPFGSSVFVNMGVIVLPPGYPCRYARLGAMTGATSVDTVQVQAADGPADVLIARPQSDGPLPAVLVYTYAYGIRPAVLAHAERLASYGYLVATPNLFYRHGPPPVIPDIDQLIGSEDRAKLFEALGPLMAALTPEAAVADARAWLGYLAERPDVRDGP